MKNLFYYFLLLLFIVLASFTSGNKRTNDTLFPWSDSLKLTWDDFQGKAPANAATAAVTYTELSLDPFDYKPPVCKIIIKAMFNKTDSWVKKESKTDYLLKHEQIHFDIAELYARKLRKGVIEATFDSKKLQSELNSIFSDCNSRLAAYEAKYDKETNHSRISDAQEKWEIDIPKELEKLNDFSDTLIEITLK